MLQPSSQVQTRSPDVPGLSRSLVWVLAIACAVSVANLYYSQPLLVSIAHSFSVSDSSAGLIATLTQLGYALGLLLIVPLGDAFNRRNLITGTLAAVALALVGIALAPSLLLLDVASIVMGCTTVVPQIIVPFAASLARPEERGRIVGMVMSGLLIGILLARTISGFISVHLGWRAVYWLATGLMLLLIIVLRLTLPQELPREKISYPALLRSLAHLFKHEKILHEVSVFGGLTFGAFQVFWVTITFFLSTPLYHFNSDAIGLFGLVGVVGALTASVVGKRTDRSSPRSITGVMMVLVLLTYVVFWLASQALWGLIGGVILLDLGTQGTQISNQARIYTRPQSIHSRLNTIYMFWYFIGGTLGTGLGTFAWGIAGWPGVCLVGVILMTLALGVYLVRTLRTT